jgi:transcriptional regulator with XRE-family HTH domain
MSTNLLMLRARKNVTQTEAAEAMGFDPSYLSKLERGDVRVGIKNANKLADYYEVDVAEILGLNVDAEAAA